MPDSSRGGRRALLPACRVRHLRHMLRKVSLRGYTWPAWGILPGDNANDAYILVDTDEGMLVYDPPTRQLSSLEALPNKNDVIPIRS